MRSIDLIKDYLLSDGYKAEDINLGRARPSLLKVVSPSGKTLTFDQDALSYPFAASMLRSVFSDKDRSYSLMSNFGVPIPDTLVIGKTELDNGNVGQALLTKYGKVVVKPIDGQRSNGLTIDITSEEALLSAVHYALQFSEKTLVQEQFIGEEARFVIINGKVEAVMIRQKPSVTGDGHSTIGELVEAENEQRKTITSSMVQYPVLTDEFVPSELLTSTRIPAEGERVELNRSTMIRGGASVYNIMSTVHPTYIQTVEAIAKNFGKGLFVVDFMSKDFTQPAVAGNYVFIEFNINSALPLYYSCRDGNHFAIIEDFLGPMLKEAIEQNSLDV